MGLPYKLKKKKIDWKFFSTSMFLVVAGIIMLAISIYLWKMQESRNLKQIYASTEDQARLYTSETEASYNSIYTRLVRLAKKGVPGNGSNLVEWNEDADFYIRSYHGLQSVALVNQAFRIQLIQPFDENQGLIDQVVNEVVWGPLDVNLLVPIYEGLEFKGYVLGTVNIGELLSPVIEDIGNDYMLRISQEGKIIFSSENWKEPRQGYLVGRVITLENTTVLNISFAPTDEFITHGIANARNTLFFALLFSAITLLTLYFAQRFLLLSKLNEMRYRNTLESMLEGCQIIGPDWRYLFVNDTAASQNKRSKEEMLGRTMMEIDPEIEKSKLFPLLRSCMQEHTSQKTLILSKDADNSERWYQLSIQPAPDGIFILSEDVSEQKRAEEDRLRNAEELVAINTLSRALAETLDSRQIFNLLGEAVWQLLPDICNLFISQFDPDKELITCLYAKMDDEILDPAELPPIPLEERGVGTQSEAIHTREPIIINNLRERIKKVKTSMDVGVDDGRETQSGLYIPMIAKEKVIGVIQVQSYSLNRFIEKDADLLRLVGNTASVAIENARLFEETSKLNIELEQRVSQRTAQLTDANKELEAFSYSVSHDLRAPLRGIDGWSLALLEDYGSQLDGEAKTYLERVRSETQRMGTLIDDLLQLSRLTRSEMTIRKVNLSAIAGTISAHLQEEQPDRQVEFIIQPQLNANGDAPLLEIALTNLLDNAFKFTAKTPQACIQFGQTEIDGQPAFFVCDNGVGFDMAMAKKLFGAFQRMHKASDFPGTGIGLSTVQRIVHRHGGSIWAKAAVNQGATFYFTLKEIS